VSGPSPIPAHQTGRADFRIQLSDWFDCKAHGGNPAPEKLRDKDELTGQVITNAFTTGMLSVEEVERDWKIIVRGEDAPVSKALITLLGAVTWGQ
jgi:hypothetical protein